MRHRTNFSPFGKMFFAAATLAGALMLSGAPQSRAEDCQQRIVKIDHELHKAAEKHGWDSPEVATKRAELNGARQWCWEHGHRWWDEDGQKWHTERDWDEHDHDHGPH
ncbi:MAG TPA: hypothetical protein VKH15_14695 [Candidatus Acidoferrum sp.]|nr:hypothetical protein [Candidatus Acidoferrum sp.]